MGLPVFDAASEQGSTGEVASLTWSHTCGGANRLLVVGVAIRFDLTVSGITYNGVALTKLQHVTVNSGSNNIRAELWYLVAPATGAHDIVVTPSANARLACGGMSFTAANQGGGATTFGTVATATSSGGSTTPSVVVTSAADQLVVDVVGVHNDGITGTTGASQTERYDVDSDSGTGDVSGMGSQEAGAASVTMSWTLSSSSRWAIVGVGIKVATVVLAGSQPTATGVLSRIAQKMRALAGLQPAATGLLTRRLAALRATDGAQEAASGALEAIKAGFSRALDGAQEAATGTLAAVWTQLRLVAGSQPTATGILARGLYTGNRVLGGIQAAATGVLSVIAPTPNVAGTAVLTEALQDTATLSEALRDTATLTVTPVGG